MANIQVKQNIDGSIFLKYVHQKIERQKKTSLRIQLKKFEIQQQSKIKEARGQNN